MCSAWDTEKNVKVVVKKIRLTNLNLKYVLEEVITHKSSTHPSIVAFLDCFFVLEDQVLLCSLSLLSHVSQELWVSLEYMAGGNLTKRLAKPEGLAEVKTLLFSHITV